MGRLELEIEPVLQLDAGLDIGMNYEFLEEGNVSPYIGLGAGLRYYRLEALDAARETFETSDEVMPVLLMRLGLRMFRFYDFNMDIFTSGYLPCIPAGGGGDVFSEKVFSPMVQLGVGATFARGPP